MKDLHIHTNHSDGEFSPKELLPKIKEVNIDEFAICDHDTIMGALEMRELVKDSNIKFHMGVEFSCRLQNFGVNIHILGYDFNENHPKIQEILQELRERRDAKIKILIKYCMEKYNYEFTDEELNSLNDRTKIVGKPHFFAIINQRLGVSAGDFYREVNKLQLEETKVDAIRAIECINEAGGISVLAHPKEIEEEYNIESYDVIEYLSQFGLKGLEVKSSKHNSEDIYRFVGYAQKLNLLTTKGSDYHGPRTKPNVHLSKCYKD